MQRIFITEKGLELSKQLRDELEIEKQMIHQQKNSTKKQKKDFNDTNILEGLNQLTQRSQDETYVKVKQTLQSNMDKELHSIKQLIKEETNLDQLNKPYIEKRITDFSKKVLLPSKSCRPPGLSMHDGNQSMRSQLSQSILPSHSRNSSNSISILQFNRLQDDLFMQARNNQILNAEAKIDRILKKYSEFQKSQDKLQQQINNNYAKIQSEKNSEFVKKIVNKLPPQSPRNPKFARASSQSSFGSYLKKGQIQQMKIQQDQEVEDDIEYGQQVLQRQTRYKFRARERLEEIMHHKWKKGWQKVHLPKLTQKYQNIYQNNRINSIDNSSSDINIDSNFKISNIMQQQ